MSGLDEIGDNYLVQFDVFIRYDESSRIHYRIIKASRESELREKAKLLYKAYLEFGEEWRMDRFWKILSNGFEKTPIFIRDVDFENWKEAFEE